MKDKSDDCESKPKIGALPGYAVGMRFGRTRLESLPPGECFECFACGHDAKPWFDDFNGAAARYGVLEIKGSPNDDGAVLLCQDCFQSVDETSSVIIRKVWNSPDLEILEGDDGNA